MTVTQSVHDVLWPLDLKMGIKRIHSFILAPRVSNLCFKWCWNYSLSLIRATLTTPGFDLWFSRLQINNYNHSVTMWMSVYCEVNCVISIVHLWQRDLKNYSNNFAKNLVFYHCKKSFFLKILRIPSISWHTKFYR